jgi:dTDP-4-dehydrorhamnose 3,5-epimerase
VNESQGAADVAKLQETVPEPLETRALEISDIKIFRGERRKDRRGYVVPSYSRRGLLELGVSFDVVHENHCWSERAGTIRGFHFQLPPFAQAKLIRVTSGRILDVNVDLRRGSPTFGRHAKVELDADEWSQIFVPEGFAHCYCTLTDDVEVVFKLGCEYAPRYARGLRWDDPDLGIEWTVAKEDAIVLDRDLDRPRFRDLTELFPYRTA